MNMGQNLAYMYTFDGGVNLTQMVNLWVAQKVDYDYETDTCQNGASCGQYAQVVWADTTRVGTHVETFNQTLIYRNVHRPVV